MFRDARSPTFGQFAKERFVLRPKPMAYRIPDSPLMTRERAIEQDLVATRQMLDAYSNEEVRIGRRVLTKESTRAELASITETVEALIRKVERLTSELESVRAEIVWRGERRKVEPHDPDAGPLWPLWLGAGFFAVLIAAAIACF